MTEREPTANDMMYHRRLEDMSRSDDEFVRRVSLNPANLATQSDPNTAQTDAYYHDNMAAAEDQEFRPIHRYTSGSQSEANTRRVSLSEARPKVAALVYLLQVLAVILVRRPPTLPTLPLSTRFTDTGRQSRRSNGHSTRKSRPHLPTEHSIAAQILWNYMKLDQQLRESDVIILLGNYDIRTSQHACQLWIDGWAEYILYTGIVESKEIRIKQAAQFEELAEAMNVPAECVLLEISSTDIIESIANSHKMLKSLGMKVKSVMLVHLPFMERLVLHTFLQTWPARGTAVTVTSPPTTLINFPTTTVGSMEQVIEDIAEAVEFTVRFGSESKNLLPDEVYEAFLVLRPSSADVLKISKIKSSHSRKYGKKVKPTPPQKPGSNMAAGYSTNTTEAHTSTRTLNQKHRVKKSNTTRAQFSELMS